MKYNFRRMFINESHEDFSDDPQYEGISTTEYACPEDRYHTITDPQVRADGAVAGYCDFCDSIYDCLEELEPLPWFKAAIEACEDYTDADEWMPYLWKMLLEVGDLSSFHIELVEALPDCLHPLASDWCPEEGLDMAKAVKDALDELLSPDCDVEMLDAFTETKEQLVAVLRIRAAVQEAIVAEKKAAAKERAFISRCEESKLSNADRYYKQLAAEKEEKAKAAK